MTFMNGDDGRALAVLQQKVSDCQGSCRDRCLRHDKLHDEEETRMAKLEASIKEVNTKVDGVITDQKVTEAKRFVFVGVITAICAALGAGLKDIIGLFQ